MREIAEIAEFLKGAAALPGTPGHEAGVRAAIKAAFEPFAREIEVDPLGNVLSTVGSGRVRVLIAAHQDEIGLAIRKIEPDGCLRFSANGGVDPRILPGQTVRICTRAGELRGVIGCAPFETMSARDAGRALTFDDLFIDAGLSADELRTQVAIGDPAVFVSEPRMLMENGMAGKTMDDRASIAAMLVAAGRLAEAPCDVSVCFAATVQEEIGSKGAQTAAYRVNPDFAIALDVTHAKCPGMSRWRGSPLDRPAISRGAYIHPALYREMCAAAERLGMAYDVEVETRETWTDADEIRCVRGGIPTMLLSIPLRYMHTTVETLRLDVVRDAGVLIAETIRQIADGWEEFK